MVSPQPCDSTLTFFVSDDAEEGIVDVIDNGVIKALVPGTTTVTVTLDDIKEVCTIIVTDGEEATEESTEAPTEAATTPAPTTPHTGSDRSEILNDQRFKISRRRLSRNR